LKIYRDYLKRLVDIAFSAVALVVLSPIMLMTALAIWLEDRGPALFVQQRVGRGFAPLNLMKFRSMPVNTPNLPRTEAGAVKVNKVGKFIRRTNLDELPQLIHIFRGEMSLIGPRPALFSQTELNAMRQSNGALTCRPGLTGLAQVNAYDGMTDREKADWDGRYASRISLIGDVSIVLRTFLYLTRRPPVY